VLPAAVANALKVSYSVLCDEALWPVLMCSARRPARAADSYQPLTDKPWRPFDVAVCDAVCDLTELNLSRLLTTHSSSVSSTMIIIGLLAFSTEITLSLHHDWELLPKNILLLYCFFSFVYFPSPRLTQPSTLRGTIKWVLAKGRWCSAAGKVTAGLAKSNGSLPPGGWLMSPAGWSSVHRDHVSVYYIGHKYVSK